MIILTVLRSGGDFLPEHVDRLRAQCAEFAPRATFYTLSDVPGIPHRIELSHNWPGWWSKIEVFKFGGPALYMDLDTTVIGDLEPLFDAIERTQFIALRDFMPGRSGREMGSGLMGWSGNMRGIHDQFARNPEAAMMRCTTPRHWGDQGFIEPLTPGRSYWQDETPGAVVSYKLHCRDGVPADARVICHHGKPRPWEV